MEFSGRLQAFPPSELLEWARHDRRTGALVVRRSSREKRLYFRDGAVVACTSGDPAEAFGQHLLLSGQLDEEGLIRALTHCTRQGIRLGQALEELSLMPRSAVKAALKGHIEDLVCDLFLWQRGVFLFEAEPPPEEAISPVPLDSVRLSLEGSRWADELGSIRGVLANDEVVLMRTAAALPGGLSNREKWIVARVDGRRTLAEVHRAVGGSYFRFLSAALGLCVRQVLDVVEVPADERPATREINLADLVLEEHQGAASEPAVPLLALCGLFPVWVGETAPGDGLAQQVDGETRLGEILARPGGPGLEALLAALRGGRLALLPAPRSELWGADAPGTAKPWWRRWFSP